MIKKVTALLAIATLISLPACCWNCKGKKAKNADIQKEVVIDGEVAAAAETTDVNKF